MHICFVICDRNGNHTCSYGTEYDQWYYDHALFSWKIYTPLYLVYRLKAIDVQLEWSFSFLRIWLTTYLVVYLSVCLSISLLVYDVGIVSWAMAEEPLRVFKKFLQYLKVKSINDLCCIPCNSKFFHVYGSEDVVLIIRQSYINFNFINTF